MCDGHRCPEQAGQAVVPEGPAFYPCEVRFAGEQHGEPAAHEDLVVGDPIISMLEGVILPWGEPTGHLRQSVIPGLAKHYGFDPNAPWGELPAEVRRAILHGSGTTVITFPYKAGGKAGSYKEVWEGVLANVMKRYDETTSEHVREQLHEHMTLLPCDACGGTRLRPESLAVTVAGRSIGDVGALRNIRNGGGGWDGLVHAFRLTVP